MAPEIAVALIVVVPCLVFFALGYYLGRMRLTSRTREGALTPARGPAHPPANPSLAPLAFSPAIDAAGVFGALADCGLSPDDIHAWVQCPRPELDDLTPRQAMLSGRGRDVLELAVLDSDRQRDLAEQPTGVL